MSFGLSPIFLKLLSVVEQCLAVVIERCEAHGVWEQYGV